MVTVGQKIRSMKRRAIVKSNTKSGSGGRRSEAADRASKAACDNRSRQLNPQHDAYWRGRGHEAHPHPSPDGTSKNARGPGAAGRRDTGAWPFRWTRATAF